MQEHDCGLFPAGTRREIPVHDPHVCRCEALAIDRQHVSHVVERMDLKRGPAFVPNDERCDQEEAVAQGDLCGPHGDSMPLDLETLRVRFAMTARGNRAGAAESKARRFM